MDRPISLSNTWNSRAEFICLVICLVVGNSLSCHKLLFLSLSFQRETIETPWTMLLSYNSRPTNRIARPFSHNIITLFTRFSIVSCLSVHFPFFFFFFFSQPFSLCCSWVVAREYLSPSSTSNSLLNLGINALR